MYQLAHFLSTGIDVCFYCWLECFSRPDYQVQTCKKSKELHIRKSTKLYSVDCRIARIAVLIGENWSHHWETLVCMGALLNGQEVQNRSCIEPHAIDFQYFCVHPLTELDSLSRNVKWGEENGLSL